MTVAPMAAALPNPVPGHPAGRLVTFTPAVTRDASTVTWTIAHLAGHRERRNPILVDALTRVLAGEFGSAWTPPRSAHELTAS